MQFGLDLKQRIGQVESFLINKNAHYLVDSYALINLINLVVLS